MITEECHCWLEQSGLDHTDGVSGPCRSVNGSRSRLAGVSAARLPADGASRCSLCAAGFQLESRGQGSGGVTRILTNQGPPSQLTVVINILVPPQSVSPHCLFILFGEKRLNISEAADSRAVMTLAVAPLSSQRAVRWQQQWKQTVATITFCPIKN